MKFRFWGVRGSIPAPGPHTVRYGGNTTCIEVRTDAGGLIILDGGSGIFPLSQTLLKELPLTVHLFITHTHWDHIQGLPFFIPFFIPGNTIAIHGAFDPVYQKGIQEILAGQMQYCYFPVRESELKARITYHNVRERQIVHAGGATVTSILMNHPVLNYGYLVEADGKRLFFTGDHEWPYNIYEPGDDAYQEYEELLAQQRTFQLDFFRGVDALIMDSAYTEAEYPAKKGWGHGTFDSSLRVAREAGAQRVFLTHHEPTRSDDALERVFQEALARHPQAPPAFLAREGEWITL